MPTASFRILSVKEMEEFGVRVGKALTAGDVVVLRGELGAGKTTFARGVGLALGIHEVTSPTFVISKIYPGATPLIHVDAYRLIGSDLALFDDLDLEARIPKSITLIEWGSGFAERLEDEPINIAIDFGETVDERIVTVEGLDL